MKRSFLLITLVSILNFLGMSQNPNRGIIGINAGGIYYLGDLNKQPFSDLSYAIGGFFKHPIDQRFAISARFNYAKLKGQGTLYQGADNVSFSNTLIEVSGNVEFNFLRYLAGDDKKKYTPYVFVGVAPAYYVSDALPFIISIPFGVGYKYNLNEKFIIGAEYSMRKTFTDKIDYNSIPTYGDQKQENYFGNSDWYSIFGIYFAYKIKYRMKCPAFD